MEKGFPIPFTRNVLLHALQREGLKIPSPHSAHLQARQHRSKFIIALKPKPATLPSSLPIADRIMNQIAYLGAYLSLNGDQIELRVKMLQKSSKSNAS
jgi:hypothetical protein